MMDEKIVKVLSETEESSPKVFLTDIEKEMKKEFPTIDEGFRTILREQYLLFARKHLDYGMGNIAAGTQLKSEEEIKFALQGLWFRISDKVNRWKNILSKNSSEYNESLLDTFQDIANYAIISQLVARGLWRKNYEGPEEG